MKYHLSQYIAYLIPAVFLLACSENTGNPLSTGGSDTVTVVGAVAQIDDKTPMDGGVTIQLQLEDGATEILHFGSLFTYPPPSQERQELYAIIADVKVGDRVVAGGRRIEDGIDLEALSVLQDPR